INLYNENNNITKEKIEKGQKEKDDVGKLFKRVDTLENITDFLFYINLVVSGITIIEFEYQDLFFIINILTSLTYILLTNFNDIYYKNVAENERRKVFIKDSFNVAITDKTTSRDYYNNEEKESIKKMGLNTFENVFFTKFIVKKMTIFESLKAFVIIVLFVFLLVEVKNLEFLVLITQTVFSSEHLFKYVKFCYFKLHVVRIYRKLREVFVVNPPSNENVFIVNILDSTMDYECLKFYCKVSLSFRIYKKYNEKLNKEWDNIYENAKKNSKSKV
ncbi:hypothetical protein BCR36DRAFT_459213, partial [Piromyces finnis]